jgi:biotin carboxyl carrier protein
MPELRSPLTAQIVEWRVRPGDTVHTGDLLLVLEAMKMEHEVRATAAAWCASCSMRLANP